jgi:hypothetical protein
MIKSVLRFLVFCVAVLLVGQINVSGQTIGEHVQTNVTSALTWTGNWLRGTKWAKSVGGDRVITELMTEKKRSTKAKPVEAGLTKKAKPNPHREQISIDDQKLIRNLLE